MGVVVFTNVPYPQLVCNDFFFFFLTAEHRLVNFCLNIASWPVDIFPKKG